MGTWPRAKRRLAKDATQPLVFEVATEDVRGSIVLEPTDCAGARALCRLPEVVAAELRRSVALVEFADGTILRYQNSNGTKKAVDTFDQSAGFFPPGQYALYPVKPSARLGERQKRDQKNEKKVPQRKNKGKELRVTARARGDLVRSQ